MESPKRQSPFEFLTRQIAMSLDRRRLGGLATSLILAVTTAATVPARKKRKKKKKKRSPGCRNGCPPNHLCSGGRCVPACTTGRPCGAACCRNTEVCVDEQCVVPCQDGRPRCGGVCCAANELCNANGQCDDALTGNLIDNGDAEAGEASPNGRTPVPIPGWTVTTGGTTVVEYGNTTGGWPDDEDPGPPDRGRQLFTGGNHGLSEATQTANVADFAAQIDGGRIAFELAGFLGGYASQGDNAKLTAIFLNAGGAELGLASIGPVTTAERASETGLLFRSTDGPVPIGTRQIKLVLTQTRSSGTSNDGYADNLSLVLRVV